MYGFLLQDWTTIRGAQTVTSVTQSESNWVSLQPYQDLVFWLEVREVTLSTGTLTLAYETAPLKDESLFIGMTTAVGIAAVTTTPTITKILLQQNPTVPLARWVRWRLNMASATGVWDLTFRIACAANAVGALG